MDRTVAAVADALELPEHVPHFAVFLIFLTLHFRVEFHVSNLLFLINDSSHVTLYSIVHHILSCILCLDKDSNQFKD